MMLEKLRLEDFKQTFFAKWKQNQAEWNDDMRFQNKLAARQPRKMVKHTQTIRRLLSMNCLRVFDHFMGWRLKG